MFFILNLQKKKKKKKIMYAFDNKKEKIKKKTTYAFDQIFSYIQKINECFHTYRVISNSVEFSVAQFK